MIIFRNASNTPAVSSINLRVDNHLCKLRDTYTPVLSGLFPKQGGYNYKLGTTRAFGGSQPAPRVGSGGFQNLAGQVGSGQGVLGISRVGSSRVRRFSNLTGRGRVTLTQSDPREAI